MIVMYSDSGLAAVDLVFTAADAVAASSLIGWMLVILLAGVVFAAAADLTVTALT